MTTDFVICVLLQTMWEKQVFFYHFDKNYRKFKISDDLLLRIERIYPTSNIAPYCGGWTQFVQNHWKEMNGSRTHVKLINRSYNIFLFIPFRLNLMIEVNSIAKSVELKLSTGFQLDFYRDFYIEERFKIFMKGELWLTPLR